MQLPPWVRKRPVLAATISLLITVFVATPIAISGWWAFWSDEPFAQAMTRQGFSWAVVGPLYGWFVVVLFVACVGMLGAIIGATVHADAVRRTLDTSTRGVDGELHPSINIHAEVRLLRNEDTVRVSVRNNGSTDQFVAQLTYASGLGSYPTFPLSLRWTGTQTEKREIISGQYQNLEMVKMVFVEESESFDIEIFSPTDQVRHPAASLKVGLPSAVHLFFHIQSATTGLHSNYELVLDMATNRKNVKWNATLVTLR